jgi:hypothetical protein
VDLETEILKEHSKRQVVKIGTWIGRDQRRFKQLMELFLRGEDVITQRSAWVVGYCVEHHPDLAKPWLKSMLEKTQEPGVHDAVKRNVTRILECVEIPGSLMGLVVSICFENLGSIDSPIAVKAYSMGVLLKICEREPDLKHELQAVIEQMIPFVGPALQARGRQVIRKLERDNRRLEKAKRGNPKQPT